MGAVKVYVIVGEGDAKPESIWHSRACAGRRLAVLRHAQGDKTWACLLYLSRDYMPSLIQQIHENELAMEGEVSSIPPPIEVRKQ